MLRRNAPVATASRWLVVASLLAAASIAGCDSCGEAATTTSNPGPPPPGGLTAEQASQVLAKVGDRTITLGDYAATLERMNRFDRLRYQTDERRQALLDELIDLELLAAEARRRGLDQRPAVQAAIRRVLRDAVVATALEALPALAEIPAGEVAAYYEAHKDDFVEPERRRVAAIVLTDSETARDILAKVREEPTAKRWAELYWGWSFSRPDQRPGASPDDLAGDLGIVGPPGVAGASHAAVPEEVRAAVFRLESLGDVFEEIVPARGRYYLVRLTGKSHGHTRSLEEADRAIRVALLQQKRDELEAKLEADLRRRFPVSIDQAALAAIPAASASGATAPSASPSTAPATSGSAPTPSPSSGEGAPR